MSEEVDLLRSILKELQAIRSLLLLHSSSSSAAAAAAAAAEEGEDRRGRGKEAPAPVSEPEGNRLRLEAILQSHALTRAAWQEAISLIRSARLRNNDHYPMMPISPGDVWLLSDEEVARILAVQSTSNLYQMPRKAHP